MERRTRVKLPSGESVEGLELGFKTLKEDWNEYQTEDGAHIKFKAVVSKIVRTERRDSEGNPVYIIQSSNVVAVSGVPEELTESKGVH